MNGKNIVAAIGILLFIVAAGVIGVAMYLVDQDAIGLDMDYCRALGGQKSSSKSSKSSKLHHVAMRNDMELRGHWNGMAMAPLSSKSAVELGLSGAKDGAALVYIDPNTGARARQSGLQVGDVIVGIDGKHVDSLAELHAATKKTQAGTPTLVDVQRNGQSMTFVIPGQMQTIGFGVGVAPAMGMGMGMGMGMQVAAGPQFVCPQDGTLVPAAQAQATGQVCPLCRGRLHPMGPNSGQVR